MGDDLLDAALPLGHAPRRDGDSARGVGALTAAFDLVGDAVGIFEVEGDEYRLVFANRSLAAALEREAEALVGLTPDAMFPPGAAAEARELIGDVARQGRSRREVLKAELLGEPRYFELVLDPITEPDGRCTHVLGVARDLTERHAIEDALRESEERFRSLADSAPLGIFRAEADTGNMLVNQRFCEIFDREEQDLLGLSWMDAIDEADRARIERERADAWGQHREFEFAYRIRRRDGEVRWLRARGRPVDLGPDQPQTYVGTVEDVTERRRAEERAARLAAVCEVSTDFVGIADRSGRVVYLNGAARRLIGLAPDAELSGLMGVDLLAEHDRERLRALDDLHDTWKGELTFLGAGGREVTMSVVLLAHEDDGGEVHDYSLVGRDITVEKAIERELAHSEARFRSLVEAASDTVVVTDRLGRVRFAAPTLRSLLGVSPADAAGRLASDYLHPDDRRAAAEVFADVVRGGGRSAPVEARLLHADGMVRWVEAILTNRLDDPNVGGVVLNIRDVTERKTVEDAHRRSQELFRSLADASPIGVIAADREGNVTYANRTWCEITGRSLDEVSGAVRWEMVHPDDRAALRSASMDAVTSGKSFRAEFRLERPDGEFRWLRSRAAPVMTADGTVESIVGFLEDVTEEVEERTVTDRLTAMLGGTPDYASIVDGEQHTLFLNPASRRLFGLALDADLADFDIMEHYPRWARVVLREQGRPALAEHGVWRGEAALIEAGGREVPVSLVTVKHTGPSGAVYYSTISRDISGLKAVEAQLAESEAWFRSILQHGVELVTVRGVDGTLRYLSPSVTEMLGWTQDELYAVEMLDHIHPDDRTRLLRAGQELLDAGPGAVRTVEYRAETKSGEWRHLEARLVNLVDDPVIKGTVTHARDITERRQAEQARRRSEAALRTIVRNSPVAVIAVDREGVVRFWNPAAEEIFGWSAEEALGEPMPFVPSEAWADGEEIRCRVFGGETVRNLERTRIRKDGRALEISISMAPVRGATGRIASAILVISDVTGRKRAEEALRASEERFRSLVQHSSDLLTVYDPSGRLTYVSPSVERFLGMTADELLGSSGPSDLAHPDDRRRTQAIWAELLAEGAGASRTFELRARAASGDWRWIELVVTNHLGDPYIDGLIANARDVTERVTAGAALEQINEALRRSNETLSAIVENSPLAIHAFDLDGKILLWNPACEELYGWTAEETIGRFSPPVRESDLDLYADVRRRVMQGETLTAVPGRGRRKDGSEIDVSFSTAPMRDENGQVTAVLAISTDITKQLEAERTLRDSEERFRSLVQHASDIITVLDEGGLITYTSPATEQMLGYREDETIGIDVFSLVHPDDVEHVAEAFTRTLEQGGLSELTEFRLRRTDGSWVWVEAVASNLLAEPSVGGVVVTTRDITERRTAQEALRRSEEWASALVQNLTDVVTVFRRDGTLVFSSPSHDWGFDGLGPGDVLEDPFSGVHPDDRARVLEYFRSLVAGESGPGPLEYRVRGAEGSSWRTVESVGTNLLDDPAVEGVVLTTRDVTDRQRAEVELAASEARYRAIVEDQTELIIRFRADGTLTFVNEAFARYFGSGADDVVGRSWFGFVGDSDRDGLIAVFRSLTPDQLSTTVEHRAPVEGRMRWLQWTLRLIASDVAGAEYQAVGRDVTEMVQAEQLVSDQARILGMVAKGAGLNETLTAIARAVEAQVVDARCSLLKLVDGTLQHGAAPSLPAGFVRAFDGVEVAPEAGTCGAAAYRRSEVVSGDIATDPLWASWRSLALDYGIRACWALPIIASDGEKVLGTLAVYYEEAREPSAEDRRLVGVASSLATIAFERKEAEEELAHQAHHDPLTGLPNRTLFFEFLMRALGRAKRYRSALAVLFLDLDRFKNVNDSLGHDAGDELLQSLAERLERVLRPTDTVARFGGDEFTILCEDLSGPQAKGQAVEVAERLLAVVQEPFYLEGQPQFLSASIGIALAGGEEIRPESLLRDADAAMYRAKERGKSRWEFFDEQMRAHAVLRLETENALHRAIDRGEFRVFYQPVVSLTAGRCIGSEALVRWQHPERGLVAPAEFIDLAEETGLIIPLGAWVLEEACRQAARWSVERGIDNPFVVSVNLSGRQLALPDLADRVTAALDRAGADPGSLCLEITESVLMEDAEDALGTIQELKALGVRLSIDDFGTGYSSLGYLKRFPVDSVKIDRSFIDGLGTDPEDSAIVAAVVSLGHALGLAVHAEGVETQDQLAELVELGCDEAQGFFFAPPQPALDVTDIVTRPRAWRAPGSALMRNA